MEKRFGITIINLETSALIWKRYIVTNLVVPKFIKIFPNYYLYFISDVSKLKNEVLKFIATFPSLNGCFEVKIDVS